MGCCYWTSDVTPTLSIGARGIVLLTDSFRGCVR